MNKKHIKVAYTSRLSGGSYTAAGLAMPRLQEIMACFYRV